MYVKIKALHYSHGFALNIFNLVDSKENYYREYSVKAGKIIYAKGGRVVSSACNPIRKLKGETERKYMIVVEFPSVEVFQDFLDEAEEQNIHYLREINSRLYMDFI